MNKINLDIIKYILEDSKTFKEDKHSFHSLESISIDANFLFNFDSNYTLSILQNLYQKGYISYPRTQERVVSSFEIDEISIIFDYLESIYTFDKELLNIKKIPNSFKSLSGAMHIGIVLTEKKVNYSDLNNDEIKIYELVVKTYISQFIPTKKELKIIKNIRDF